MTLNKQNQQSCTEINSLFVSDFIKKKDLISSKELQEFEKKSS